MGEVKIDRRVKYTKALLKDALVELMGREHVSAISVKSLCERADVNRSTFYAHYASPHDLLAGIVDEVLHNLKQNLMKHDFYQVKPLSSQILAQILEYIRENSSLFNALLSENCDFHFQKDILELAQIISTQVFQSQNARIIGYLDEYAINGCISVIKKWLQGGAVETPSELAEFMVQVMYQGMNSLQ